MTRVGPRWLLFTVLVAGAAVWWSRAGREVAANLGSLRRLGAAIAAGTGPASGGDPAFARIAAQLLRAPRRDGPALVLGGDRAEATWIAYLAYPRLLRDEPTARIEAALRRLDPGPCTLVVIPPADATGEEAREFAGLFRRSLLGPFGMRSAEVAYRDPSGIAIFEAVR